jgi:hypothetical protein
MEKPKAGLHKKISSIFDGVPVPKSGDEQQLPPLPGADFRGHIPPQPQMSLRRPQSPPPRPSQRDVFVGTAKPGFFDDIIEKLAALKPQQLADKQKIKILIVTILAIILILVLYRSFAGSSKSVAEGPDAQNVKVGPAAAASAIVWQKPEPYPVYMRDPTQISTAGSYAAGTGSIAVRGIVYSEDRPSVVIGNEIMYEGDTIGGVTILKINNDSVEFKGQGKIWTQKVQ